MADALELHVTMPDAERAASLARALVDEGLAACVNIVPGLKSIYIWQGKREEDDEVLCLVKTTAAVFERTRARILELHPYEVPEILAFEAKDGNPAYLDWVRRATTGR